MAFEILEIIATRFYAARYIKIKGIYSLGLVLNFAKENIGTELQVVAFFRPLLFMQLFLVASLHFLLPYIYKTRIEISVAVMKASCFEVLCSCVLLHMQFNATAWCPRQTGTTK